MEMTSQFADVYEQLPNLDFDLLGDASKRNPNLLGDYKDQKLRLCKLFALRKVIKHSHKTKSKLEQERLKRKAKEKTQVQKVKAQQRIEALKVLNDDNVSLEYLVKGEQALKNGLNESKGLKAESDFDSSNRSDIVKPSQ